jgi:plastocyanin
MAATGCGGGSTADSPANVQASPKATVVLTDGAYRPARVRVEAGSRVTFVNRSTSPNTAETDGVGFFEYDRRKLDRQNRFDLHIFQPGEAESVELDTPGTYRFHSSLDSEMKGVIEVVERAD